MGETISLIVSVGLLIMYFMVLDKFDRQQKEINKVYKSKNHVIKHNRF
jgi:hypothetical protein